MTISISGGGEAKPAKRIRRDPADAKALILQTAEKIMLEEGYAAVTIRRVAKTAGVSSTLLHYYYPAADDLLLALYQHSCDKDFEMLERALRDAQPIEALWAYQIDSTRTALAGEYLALANHKKVIRAEIARSVEHARTMQIEMIGRVLAELGHEPDDCSPACISMLLTSVSRNLIIEGGVGISLGHAEAKAYVERALSDLIRPRKQAPAA